MKSNFTNYIGNIGAIQQYFFMGKYIWPDTMFFYTGVIGFIVVVLFDIGLAIAEQTCVVCNNQNIERR